MKNNERKNKIRKPKHTIKNSNNHKLRNRNTIPNTSNRWLHKRTTTGITKMLTQEQKQKAIKKATEDLKAWYKNDRETLKKIETQQKQQQKLSIDEQYEQIIQNLIRKTGLQRKTIEYFIEKEQQ